MDKSGIFKLLNSFYDYYKKNAANKDDEKPLNGQNSEGGKGGFGGLSFLQNLLPKGGQPEKEKIESPAPQKQPPLQSKMLGTMENHDRILKSVLKDNAKLK